MEFDNDDIENIKLAAIDALREVHNHLENIGEVVGTTSVKIEGHGEEPKSATVYDVVAEAVTHSVLHQNLDKYNLKIFGEELGEEPLTEDLNLTGQDRLVALLDMVDGTDLFERHLSNWCSAMVFYHPAEGDPEKRILAALVALPNEEIYFTHRGSKKVERITLKSSEYDIRSVSGPSTIKDVSNASLAFYGQKIKSFLSVVIQKIHPLPEETVSEKMPYGFHPFVLNLKQLEKKVGVKTRIYNLGGNPIMMRIIDGVKRMDGLFNLGGSLPHDAIPGLYIAKRAGAILRDTQGNPYTDAMLGEKLMRPADDENRVSYILTSTEELADELFNFVT